MRHFSLIILALTASSPALAGSGASDALTEIREQEQLVIEATGITAFDSVFMKAKAIHDTLDGVQGRILGAQDKIAAAIGLPEGAPIRTSMWELKQKAGGPLEVKLQDGKPVLTVGGAGSAEAQQLVQAVNTAVADLAQIPNELAQLPAQVRELVAACQAFPGQLNPQLLAEAGMKPLELPKVAKTLGKNVKAVVATPKRVDTLVKASKDFLTGIPQGIAATEPPTEPVQVASKGKDKKEKAPKGGTSSVAAADDLPASPISAMVDDALASFHDAEVASAVQLLGQADASLANLGAPVPEHDLETLYQTAALVHLVDGNAAAATAAVAQALVVDPESRPLAHLGPEYAKLHKSLVKSGIIRTVEVPVSGSGVAYISGKRIDGADSVRVATGKHLLQVKRGDQWVSQVVWVDDSFQLTL
jgi:hypothetical protein